MRDETIQDHPDIETLAGHMTGSLEGAEAETTSHHLKDCPVCRLEVKRLERFAEVDTDAELDEEADWQSARLKLERAFREKVLPEIVPDTSAPEVETRDSREPTPWWTRWQIRWLAPVAAAAAVVLIVIVNIGRFETPGGPAGDLGPVRGTPTETPDIALVKPVGEITEAPKLFVWTPKTENDYYAIAIFTSDLKKIYGVDRVEETQWAATDSLMTLFEPETIYLWSVTGHKGLEREAVSPNGWFIITTEDR